jgi:hypothetical protein
MSLPRFLRVQHLMAMATVACLLVSACGEGPEPAPMTPAPTGMGGNPPGRPPFDPGSVNIPTGIGPDGGSPPSIMDPSAAVDPCFGETAEGSCTPAGARTCVTPTGNSAPALVQSSCEAYEECKMTSIGAACAPKEGACEAGASQCEGPDRISACVNNQWQMLPCAGGCLQTALGDFCRLKVESQSYSATIKYEARTVNEGMTDWAGTTFVAPAQGMVVASFRGDDLIDADITTPEGKFTVNIPAQLQPSDRIIALLVHPTVAKTSLAIAIGRPDVADGELDPRMAMSGKPTIWQWAIDPNANPTGSELTITEKDGGGAVRLFDNLRKIYADTKALLTKEGKPLIVWLRMNTAWTCGACQFDLQAKVGPITFLSQVAIGGTAQDTDYWSDAVTAHELFHWIMRSYGASPNEGGRHCLSVPVLPGMAWSEGFATGFSSIVRNSPFYYSKQEGTFFWFDIAKRFYGRGKTWQRPSPSLGLDQLHDENDVAAMLYALSKDPAVGPDRMLQALSSPRMTEKPFLRGYFTNRWTVGAGCKPTNIMKTTNSAPFLADFLDALRCSGVPAANIDAVTEPGMYYPYPSQTPLCR